MLKTFSRLMLATCVVATGFSLSPTVSPAGAGQVQLHELLFSRKKREQVRRQRQGTQQQRPAARSQRQAAPRQAAPRRAIQRVASESYYTYKAESLSLVTLASLLPDLDTTASVEGQDPQADVALPPMMTLSAQAPDTGDDTITVPQSLSEEPVEAPRVNLFALGTQQAPEESLRIEADIADALRNLYAERKDFVWSDGETVSDEAKATLHMMAAADAHGLNPDHYDVDMPDLSGNETERAHALVAFDVAMTARSVRFARDLKDGVINPNKLSGYHDFKDGRLSATEAATALADKINTTAWLASLAPQQPDYAKLQAELAALADAEDDAIALPEKIMMRPGSVDDALPIVMKAVERKLKDETREKHATALNGYSGTTLYDGALVDLVRDVQRDLGLNPDGIVGPQTAARLGGDSVQERISKVKFALERLRWHPEEYADRHVVINAPEYRVRYLENNETKLAMNTVVGRPDNQTYFFHDEIETVVFNPYWGVPQSIIVNTYLPRLHRDASYLDRNGFVVTSHSGKRISSSAINWRQYSGPVPFNVRQKPGPSNALGELKILFPNEHAIYMHDTPAKDLFARDARAYSHGCVRLEDPRAMAAAVLGKDMSYIEGQFGPNERAEKLNDDVHVYVGYFTAWPNDDGVISYHPDVYKRDTHLEKAMDSVESARAG